MDNEWIATIAIILGFLLRFGLPLGLTFLLGRFLRHLDARWAAEAAAEIEQDAAQAATQPDVKCWQIQRCPPRLRTTCPAYAQPDSACYDLFRTNGRLKPACRTCRVARRANVPVFIPA